MRPTPTATPMKAHDAMAPAINLAPSTRILVCKLAFRGVEIAPCGMRFAVIGSGMEILGLVSNRNSNRQLVEIAQPS